MHKCYVYMRFGTAAQIDDKRERGILYENLAQIFTNEKAPRGARFVQQHKWIATGNPATAIR